MFQLNYGSARAIIGQLQHGLTENWLQITLAMFHRVRSYETLILFPSFIPKYINFPILKSLTPNLPIYPQTPTGIALVNFNWCCGRSQATLITYKWSIFALYPPFPTKNPFKLPNKVHTSNMTNRHQFVTISLWWSQEMDR